MLTCNLTQSQHRRERLNNYLNENVLADNRFLCNHYEACRSSHPGVFYEGQLHHVGQCYDLNRQGKPLRVVVIGMSYGHPPAKVTLKARRHMILVETGLEKEFKAGNLFPHRNFHMKGTTSLLRLIFDIPFGTDHASEFIRVNQRERVHLFDAFALVNILLCSAIEQVDSTTDKSTALMRRNCRHHLRKTLEILAPTVAIVQGKGIRDHMLKSLDGAESIGQGGTTFRAHLEDHTFSLLTFSHPSARDGTGWASENAPYLLNTIAPIIEKFNDDKLV